MDLASIVTLAVPVLGALGIGSLIGQWAAGGKDRRVARASVLEKLAAVEQARWYSQGREIDVPKLVSASRQLEVAALIARVPRHAVIPYIQLAGAAMALTQDTVDNTDDPMEGGIESTTANLISDAAAIVSRAAWSSPTTRWIWLRLRIRALQNAVSSIEDERFQTRLKFARENIH